MSELDNANPLVFEITKDRQILPEEEDDSVTDKFDRREIFGRFQLWYTILVLCVCFATIYPIFAAKVLAL